MSFLSGKNVLLGISGGIAAYKAPFILRLLKKRSCEVKVIMTTSAKDFVSPLTLSTLSENNVLSTFTSDNKNDTWNNHVSIAKWADLFIIAPATSNIISSMASAKCDNLLIATYLSFNGDVYIAPSMDLDMYENSANQKNIDSLINSGKRVLPVGTGYLASGLEGKGRMLEPEEIIQYIEDDLSKNLPLNGKKVLITAGPTYESIDPIRFIANKSSGKMGFALAKRAAELGSEVFLFSGPTSLDIVNSSVKIIRIDNSDEMFEKVMKKYDEMDIVISAAAISDFKSKTIFSNKIKNNEQSIKLEFIPTKDILEQMGKRKKNQLLIGFALETENAIENSLLKLKNKNLDAIVLNSFNEDNLVFGSDENKITYIRSKNDVTHFDIKSKYLVAKDIFDQILSEYA
ncbi:MAG: bifunctional phosphopantothenoylcysteine decarboxylase/phosphopantothenate--cysteine ligase CoaBC [Flavobacteriaceae bacterium]|nr:bifunctional phosphopantothenoylcysteine decarboxylase/phosphopantothenate--cysteine ligase CoaBC [Flavobacteriaceae bacterium]|tara:strand:+ start:491 stop:1696 length:1206 start_codon:yes stop_codon:yes gene_type:complete